MRKFTTSFAVSILTLFVGVASFVLWSIPYTVEEIPVPQVKRNIPQGWEKVDVSKGALYLPPNMKSLQSCHEQGGNGGFGHVGTQKLEIMYGYGEISSCESILNIFDLSTAPSFNVEVSGRRAMYKRWGDENLGAKFLCFPDVGDGRTGLHLTIKYNHNQGAATARQVIESIEFR